MITRRLVTPLRQTLSLARAHCATNARMDISGYRTREGRIAEERRTLKSWRWQYRRPATLTGWTALRVRP